VKPSLTVVLPVCNAERHLPAQVDDLLEVLPELARRFELLVVDDGSTDETPHVAQELSSRYPQVRTVRHPVPLGLEESIQTGLDHTDGEFVVVGDVHRGLPTEDLLSLWHMRGDEHLVAARRKEAPAERAPVGRVLRRLAGRDSQSALRGVHVVRRDKFDELRLDEILPAANSQQASARPNFLGKLKAFALGE
jgi:glycosyltransferase involved in cell wall biosynthesis